LRTLDDPVPAQRDELDIRRVRQHGDQDIGLLSHVSRRAGGLRTGTHELVDGSLAPAVDNQWIAGLEQILGHGATNNTEPTKSNDLCHGGPRGERRGASRASTLK